MPFLDSDPTGGQGPGGGAGFGGYSPGYGGSGGWGYAPPPPGPRRWPMDRPPDPAKMVTGDERYAGWGGRPGGPPLPPPPPPPPGPGPSFGQGPTFFSPGARPAPTGYPAQQRPRRWSDRGMYQQPTMSYAQGGTINEPVWGQGAWSRRPYSFGERGPETVRPQGGGGVPGIDPSQFSPGQVPGFDPSQYSPFGQYRTNKSWQFAPGYGGRPGRQGDTSPVFGGDYYLQAVLDQANAQGLAQQGAMGRAAAYYNANTGGGGDPGLAGYGQLNSMLGGQANTAAAVNNAYLQKIFRDQDYARQQRAQQLQWNHESNMQPNFLGQAAGFVAGALGGSYGPGGSGTGSSSGGGGGGGGGGGYNPYEPKNFIGPPAPPGW